MTLTAFIRSHNEQILQEWDAFASTVPRSFPKAMSPKELRNHGASILDRIAENLTESQTDSQRDQKAKGLAPAHADSPAEIHAEFRMDEGFTIEAMLSEYRALRASVLRTWEREPFVDGDPPEEAVVRLKEMTRFNEAVDQAIAESVSRYTRKTKERTDLFIGVLGHEIRNPLSTIALMSHLMAQRDNVSRKEATLIERSAKRIQALVEELLDFTRAQAGMEMRLARQPGDLTDIVERMAQETRAAHPGTRLELSSDARVEGMWDVGRIEQLAANLLGNAARHGAPEQGIFVRVWSHGPDAFMEVRNFGTPISPRDLPRIFEPFAQGTSGQAASEGLGLGLHVCQEIAHAHGGAVSVESSVHSGTIFTARLLRVADPA